jgi:leader peptidase (prepilin peptidase)/N-methyltransferase
VGAALGPERALLTVVLGALVGAVASVMVLAPLAYVRHRQRAAAGAGSEAAAFELPPVPFGVFLAPAALIALLAGDRVIAWYFAHILA